MDFRITGLSPQPFKPFFQLDEDALVAIGAQRVFADDAVDYPCRVSLAHALPGEELILMSFEHQPGHSPYRAAGPVFARKSALIAFDAVNVVPEPVRVRLLSVRAYDRDDMIVEAEVAEGKEVEALIDRYFERVDVAYLHGELVLPLCRPEPPGGVFSHAQVVKDQAGATMKAAHFFSHALSTFDEGLDHADGEAAQAGDVTGAVTGANA